MNTIKLTFKNDKKLTKTQMRKCLAILDLMAESEDNRGFRIPLSSYRIAISLDITPPDVRKHIKLIRENNELFLKHSYIIATNDGYKIEHNQKALKKYHKTLSAMAHSKVKQAYQLEEVLND